MSAATVFAPRSIEEAAGFVREAARERAVVLATGGGTKLTWTKPAARVDTALSTRALTGVVAYEPGDGVITALAGTPWRELETLVARNGHHLSPTIPDAEHATVGGVVAAGQSGIDRLRFGPLRDHVLGMRVVMADGTIAKTGGRLVKNVTGFDLHRLHTGAHGTLGLVAEVSLRLHAAPEQRAIGLAFADARAQALAAARAALASRVKPWAVVVHDVATEAERRWNVAVLLAGGNAQVTDEVARLRGACPELIVTTEHDHATRYPHGASFSAMWAGQQAIEGSPLLTHRLHVTTVPSELDRVCAVIDERAADERSDVRLVLQPGLGIADACFRDLDADRARRIGTALVRAGARVHWRGLDEDLRARVDLYGGAEPTGIALMRRIRANLDPNGLWASGRIAGGL